MQTTGIHTHKETRLTGKSNTFGTSPNHIHQSQSQNPTLQHHQDKPTNMLPQNHRTVLHQTTTTTMAKGNGTRTTTRRITMTTPMETHDSHGATGIPAHPPVRKATHASHSRSQGPIHGTTSVTHQITTTYVHDHATTDAPPHHMEHQTLTAEPPNPSDRTNLKPRILG